MACVFDRSTSTKALSLTSHRTWPLTWCPRFLVCNRGIASLLEKCRNAEHNLIAFMPWRLGPGGNLILMMSVLWPQGCPARLRPAGCQSQPPQLQERDSGRTGGEPRRQHRRGVHASTGGGIAAWGNKNR